MSKHGEVLGQEDGLVSRLAEGWCFTLYQDVVPCRECITGVMRMMGWKTTAVLGSSLSHLSSAASVSQTVFCSQATPNIHSKICPHIF
ncbi:hypothetical protein RRG08_044939 [Elysia crispata]|uniref:Uncharacterized protein n=1 Tax=Elysia crispata TaxID=231223 RepID=A0AAE0ZTX6_9GAST|nr:hypothetical protein RRG08_044939 [Elysia crispata]